MAEAAKESDLTMRSISSANVINLQERLLKKLPDGPVSNNIDPGTSPKIIAVSSGKGGVGKTSIVANLGFLLSNMGKKVLLVDTDLGLGNLDVLLGITPRFNISHVLSNEKTIADIVVDGPGNMKILPASSGIQSLTHLTPSQLELIRQQMFSVAADFDAILIDTAAGISSNVLFFNASAREVYVVVTPDLTAITDAYALMKILSMQYGITTFNLLVNQADSAREAGEIFNHLQLVTHQFLDISIHLRGHILKDDNVAKGVRYQRMVSDIYPNSSASDCFKIIAQHIYDTLPGPTH
jgi:flagellar biosynthesis protein FlhG